MGEELYDLQYAARWTRTLGVHGRGSQLFLYDSVVYNKCLGINNKRQADLISKLEGQNRDEELYEQF
jgi:hypothetical protein